MGSDRRDGGVVEGRGTGCVGVDLEETSSSGSMTGLGEWSVTGGGGGDVEDSLEPVGAFSGACADRGG